MRSILEELRRRKVFQSLAAYLVASWLIIQVFDVVGPALGLSETFLTYAVITLAVGLPVVAVVAWFFELTAGGLQRESAAESGVRANADPVRGATPTFNYVIIAMLLAALAVSLISRDDLPELISAADAATQVVAVLPLQALGETASDNGFVEGLHDDLLTMLSRISSLRVISRTSVLRYGDGKQSIPEIGRKLGASSILEGSVQRDGDRIRVNVQLIDVNTDEHLWAEIFERPFEARALFSIQREIAQSISRQLRIALTGDDEIKLERLPTSNSEAYTAYLLGRQRMAQRTSDSLRQGEEFFRRAIGFDPGYAEAWAGLAETLVLQHDYAGLDRKTMQAAAMRAVQRALTLAPQLARAHVVLAELRRLGNDLQGAESSFARAVELNPNESLAAHWYGNLLYAQGRMPEAIAFYRRALELDPLSVTISNALAQTLLAIGQIDEANSQYAQSTEIDPDFVATYAHRAQLERFANGRPDQAVGLLFEAYRRDPEHSEYPALMAEALLELDDAEAAARWAAQATANAADHWWPSRAAVLVALHSGDRQALEEALQVYGPNLGAVWLTLVSERDLLLDAGDLDGARQLFIEALPDLFADPPIIDENNFFMAPVLAVVHQARGEPQLAARLLEGALSTLARLREDGYEDFDISEVEAHALLGNKEDALAMLEAQLDKNWLNLWWYVFDGSHLKALADDDRFIAMHERVRNNMHALHGRLEPRFLTPPALDPPGNL